jgi:hypothetical protein
MVDPEWQGAGLARQTPRADGRVRPQAGRARVHRRRLRDNAAIVRVLQRGDHDTRVTTSDGIHEVRTLFANEPAG